MLISVDSQVFSGRSRKRCRPIAHPFRTRRAKGFALAELAAVLVVAAVVVALLVVTQPRSRRLSSLAVSLANMQRFGTGTESYASDNQDLYFSFTWRHNRIGPSIYADIRAMVSGGDDVVAAAGQAVDIFRRRSGRSSLPVPSQWLATPLYTHIVLADYNGESLPAWWMLSPEDKYRLAWASDPIGFENGAYSPSPAVLSSRWPYSSSYERAICLSTGDFLTPTQGTITQAGLTHNQWTLTSLSGGYSDVFTDRRTAETTFPSQKALMWDSAQRHFGVEQLYCLYPDARVPILFADGAVAVRSTANANGGFNPAVPHATGPMRVSYQPDTWEPPLRTGTTAIFSECYRFTRAGLKGRDFDGDDVLVP